MFIARADGSLNVDLGKGVGHEEAFFLLFMSVRNCRTSMGMLADIDRSVRTCDTEAVAT